ncbi:MAG: nitrate/nitrite transporter NrtS [Mycolicibacterium sp.]|uniref:nitrate/nitrite transporter NrtS n=1 Tax=Mycolicibacterium sp. TaxID=2320850 RepID=UPI003D0F648F
MGSADQRRDTWGRPREALAMFLRGATVRTAGLTALLVGTVLSLVNQGAVIADGHSDGGTWVRIAINYLVPFCVASVGFISARRARSGDER